MIITYGNMKSLIQIFGVAAIVIASQSCYACQCQQKPNTFLHHLRKFDFVGYIEVIGYDTIKDHDFDAWFTNFKIIEQFQGKLVGPKIAVLDGGDVNCTHSLHYPIGTRFIVKAHYISRKEYECDYEDFPLTKNNTVNIDQILVLSICSETIIKVKDGRAIGYISRKRNNTNQPQNLDLKETMLFFDKRFRSK